VVEGGFKVPEPEFVALLLESIDEALASLGDSIKQTTHFHLEQSFSIRKEEIPHRIGAFAQALENIFGVGGDLVEIIILKKLYEKVGEVFTPSSPGKTTFLQYITAAERAFQERNRTAEISKLGQDEKPIRSGGELKCQEYLRDDTFDQEEEVNWLSEYARILVVDDDESIRKTLAEILMAEGYHVDTAENGREAMAKAEADFYNLALIDILLPDMKGTELLTKMKDTIPKMRKIIITGHPSMQNAVEALNWEANAYLSKPLDVETALQTVREQLAKQQQEKAYSENKVAGFIEARVRELEAKKIAEN
jgi:CheY-like chemotaxis protein